MLVRKIVISIIFMQCLRNLHASEIMHFLKEVPLCGNSSELTLPGDGYESTRIISLRQSAEYEYCMLTIKAPNTHVIHLQFLEDPSRIKHKLHSSMSIPCNLHIYLGDTMEVVWYGDLCTSEPLKDVELLSNKVIIRWKAAYDEHQTKGRKLIVTAIGHGEYCRKPKQHACMKVGGKPIFCVSNDVTCDGHENCPPGSKTSDEGVSCDSPDQVWRRKFIGVMNKIPNIANTIRNIADLDNSTDHREVFNNFTRTFKRLTKIETTTKPAPDTRTFGSFHDILSQYDPWGYLGLGIVLCGSLLLMCCGIWECCIRRYKSDPSGSGPPTTVPIVSSYDENGTVSPQQQTLQQPPNYDDLDLPPSYIALFPNKPPDERYDHSNNNARSEIIPMRSINPDRRISEEANDTVVYDVADNTTQATLQEADNV